MKNRNIAITLACIILGLMLAWQFKSITYNSKMASLENKREDELKDLLIAEKKKTEELSKRNAELEKENRDYENARGDDTKTVENLKKELERARIIAGLVDVKGKGLTITIDNSDTVNVDDTDILSVLNELRASDAQAISVNDERIVATSEVRVAGRYIMVNNKQMLAPFVIKAIAEPDKVERALKMVGGVLERLEAYQLKVNIKQEESILIPRLDSSVIKTNLLTPVAPK
ncbi:MAG: DUF881 domain-containing protein [Clostridiales bacterium]|nr:DUF881 domain-containing protein [Eubacteriales bacterium]MDH7565340.1 DUF881 domain-containing protein [Clostridiales bacterium]